MQAKIDKKISTTKERIIELLNYKEINVSTFFPSINLSYSNFKGRQLKSSPSTDVLAKIKTIIPDVNMEWLVTGEGTMLRTQAASESNLIGYLKEKDGKIEELLRENARLKLELEQTSGLSERVARLEAAIDKGGERAGTAKGVVG